MTLLAPATAAEVRTVLARAYVDDPLMVWAFPDEATRLDAVAAWVGLFAERSLEVGRVDVVRSEGAVVAVATWRLPDDPVPSAQALPSVPGLLTALVGAEHAAAVGAGLARMRPLVPSRPHAYLHMLAVDPGHRGRGLAREVLAHGLVRAQERGLGVHLETTNPSAVPFYERNGWSASGRALLADGGPELVAMWRPAEAGPSGVS
ncbi:GNAT family N-acetyltransferase [Actinotalea sp. AC32]|nr:GNAT family N-acetyltransferase [Actinotalea sp. AC32]